MTTKFQDLNRQSRTIIRSAMISFPIVLWVTNNMYSTYTVRGKSMEPTLQDGDIVLVRKFEFMLNKSCYAYLEHYFPNLVATSKPYENGSMLQYQEDKKTLEKVKRIDASIGKLPSFFLDTYSPLSGEVIIFKSPTEFPNMYHIKRVIGLGGQRIRPSHKKRQIQTIPLYNLWVEGDNAKKSKDSREYGTVSKKLIVGHVERLIWPPSRWGKIERNPPPLGRAWWI